MHAIFKPKNKEEIHSCLLKLDKEIELYINFIIKNTESKVKDNKTIFYNNDRAYIIIIENNNKILNTNYLIWRLVCKFNIRYPLASDCLYKYTKKYEYNWPDYSKDY